MARAHPESPLECDHFKSEVASETAAPGDAEGGAGADAELAEGADVADDGVGDEILYGFSLGPQTCIG